MATESEERNKAIGLFLAAALLLSACTTPASPAPSAPESPSTVPTAPPPTASPTPSPTASAECAARVLATMTEDQRIGQLFFLGLAND